MGAKVLSLLMVAREVIFSLPQFEQALIEQAVPAELDPANFPVEWDRLTHRGLPSGPCQQ